MAREELPLEHDDFYAGFREIRTHRAAGGTTTDDTNIEVRHDSKLH
jgi:hypothetical protein